MKAGRVVRRLCSGEGGGPIVWRWDCVAWAGLNVRRLTVVATCINDHWKSTGNAVFLSQHQIWCEHSPEASVPVVCVGVGGGILPSVWSPPPFWPESPVLPPVWPRRWHNHHIPTARSSLSGRRRWWLTSDCCDLVKRDTLFFKTNALARFLSIIRRVTALPIPIIIHRIIACRIGPNHLFV